MTVRRGAFSGNVLREILSGYGVQVLSIVLLLGQNLVLPILIGTEKFGELAFTLASSALLYAIYDHGYNLLIIRKRDFHFIYMRCKIELFSLFSLFYIGIWLFSSSGALLHPALVIPHALAMTVFSYVIHLLLADGRLRNVAYFSLVFAVFGLTFPLLLVFLEVSVIFSPLLAITCTLGLGSVLVIDKPLAIFPRDAFRLGFSVTGLRYRWGLFLKQAQVSAGTIIDSLIVWSGVFFITITQGALEAAIFRISMSIITLMTQVIPVFKPTYLRLSRQTTNFSRLVLVSGLIVIFIGFLQWWFLKIFGVWILDKLYQENSVALFSVLLPLAMVPALKVILELQTVLLDRFSALNYQLVAIVVSVVVTLAFKFRSLDSTDILLFYSVLCGSNCLYLLHLAVAAPNRHKMS